MIVCSTCHVRDRQLERWSVLVPRGRADDSAGRLDDEPSEESGDEIVASMCRASILRGIIADTWKPEGCTCTRRIGRLENARMVLPWLGQPSVRSMCTVQRTSVVPSPDHVGELHSFGMCKPDTCTFLKSGVVN